MTLPNVLTIAGSDSSGGAGIQADLKTISALGAYGASVITALTAQNTRGVQGIHEVPPDFIERQFDAVADDIKIGAAKTGMLSGSNTILTVVKKIQEFQIENLVVDPVMVATSGGALMTDDAKQTLVTSLVPLARIITPNIPEAQVLSGLVITSKEDMQQAALKIYQRGAQNVLVKGGHLDGDALDILYDGEQFHEFVKERINTQNTHGTGCTLSAAIATGLAQGKTVIEAVHDAKEYITTAIRFSLGIGKGYGPLNHTASLFREAERYRCLQTLKQAIERLKAGKYGHIIPEIQSNLGYAMPYAVRQMDVAAFPGRVLKMRDKIATLCDPEFGASQHVAKIILTVMRYNPEYRAAMAVRFSEDALNICRNAGYHIASFDRRDEPQDVKEREGSSLEWGTNSVLAGREAIPDVIFDRGDIGKEPVIRILGRTPEEVIGKVIYVAEELKRVVTQ